MTAEELLRRRGAPEWVHGLVLEVAEKHAVAPLAMVDHRYNKATVEARQEAYYRVRKLDPSVCSTVVIGDWFGRDDSTVRYGIAKHAYRHRLPPISAYDIRKKIANQRAAHARKRARKGGDAR